MKHKKFLKKNDCSSTSGTMMCMCGNDMPYRSTLLWLWVREKLLRPLLRDGVSIEDGEQNQTNYT